MCRSMIGLHDTLRPYLNSTVSISSQFDLVFDKLEILLSLSCVYQQAKSDRWSWAPAGSFIYRSENRKQILEEIESSISDHQGESSFVKFVVREMWHLRRNSGDLQSFN